MYNTQIKKLPLVEDGASSWHLELTPAAKVAFTDIFKTYAPHGGMDARDLGLYFDKYSTQTKVSSLQIRSILNRYGSLSDSRLELHGFLSYYAESAFVSPKEVWQHLHIQGYGSDLQKGASQSVEVPLPDTPLELPQLSADCLKLADFYDSAALETSEGAVIAIAKRLTYNQEDLTQQVRKLLLC